MHKLSKRQNNHRLTLRFANRFLELQKRKRHRNLQVLRLHILRVRRFKEKLVKGITGLLNEH